jgi:capsular exopolysaccharide synthesis family protein
MSKFFNETQRAEGWSSQQGKAIKLDLPKVLEAVHGPAELRETSRKAALGRCRKIRLPESSDHPVIYDRNDFMRIAVEAYRALRTRLLRLQAQKGLRSIVISSAVPGEGKTLTTLNLALCCAQLHELRVLVIDADLRTRGLTALLGHVPDPGLGEILSGTASYESAVVATDLPNLYVLGAGSSTAPPSGLYSGDRWKEFMGWSVENFNLVLVDSPPIVPLADFEQISAVCDGVLAVVRAHHARRELVKKAARTIDANKLVGVVLNASLSESSDTSYGYYGYGSKG